MEDFYPQFVLQAFSVDMYFFLRILFSSLALFLVTSLQAAAIPVKENRAVAISQAVYNDLVFYTKYCAASYGLICPKPMGNVLVKRVGFSVTAIAIMKLTMVQVDDFITGTDGMVVRDDRRKEIVVAFRGTELSAADVITGETATFKHSESRS